MNNQNRGTRPKAKVQEKEATIYLYDTIGNDLWGGINATIMVKEINDLKVNMIHVRINSPGGDVFGARAIHTALSQHPAKIITHIDGLAASAASYLALAADEIEIAEGAFFMIHDAWAFQIGDKNDMLSMAELLEKIDGTLVADYQKKTGREEAEIKAWMSAETWFTAEEAFEAGFVDRIYEGKKAENKFDLSAFRNAPKDLEAGNNFDLTITSQMELWIAAEQETLSEKIQEKEAEYESCKAAQARKRQLALMQLTA